MRTSRLLGAAALAGALVLGVAAPAFAHSELDPDRVPAGSTSSLTLKLENEKSTAATVKVELFFPEGVLIPVQAVPAAAGGWTGAPQGGAGGGAGNLGDPAPGITWTRASGSPSEDPALPFTLGPLPDKAGLLQMAVLQTYSDGSVDRWIQSWPEGSPEPDRPGPRLFLTAGATTTTAAGTGSATTTTIAAVPLTTVSRPTTTTAAEDSSSSDDGTNPWLIGGIVVVLAAAIIGGGAYFLSKRRG